MTTFKQSDAGRLAAELGDAADTLTLMHDFFRIIREDVLKLEETITTQRICRIAAHAEIVALEESSRLEWLVRDTRAETPGCDHGE
jgi:hypothetical protein